MVIFQLAARLGRRFHYDCVKMSMKVAIIHDWLVTYAGSERVLEAILSCFPEADLFSLVNFLPKTEAAFIKGKTVRTSFIQDLPLARKKFRQYLALMPLAIEQFDLSAYDLIISSSWAMAKGVITGPDQLHISYVHSPIRYAWDLQHQYLQEGGLERGLKSWIARYMLHRLRTWDYRTSNGVDHFIANSAFIARRIWKTYRRPALVIHPPVRTADFPLSTAKEDFYLTVSRMVPYKRMDLIVEAFAGLPDRRLMVIGDGPNYAHIKAKAGPNVVFLGRQDISVVRDHMQRARAFIFAAIEDFGIAPVEAMSCGTPVIGLGKGGLLETVIEGQTGLFFYQQSAEAIMDAVRRFEAMDPPLSSAVVAAQARRFDEGVFRSKFTEALNQFLTEWRGSPA